MSRHDLKKNLFFTVYSTFSERTKLICENYEYSTGKGKKNMLI